MEVIKVKIVALGWLGFWLFMSVLVGCGTYCYLKTPPNPIRDVMRATQEERMLRNMQDPLAMRLYALARPLKEYPNSTSIEVYKETIIAVIKQWTEEVVALKDSAYHTKAADSQWDISKLPLNKEQKDALSEVAGAYDVFGKQGK